MSKLARLILLIFVAAWVGCASTPTDPETADANVDGTPDWIDRPYIEGGFAATECVRNLEGKRGILMKKATALGRAELASQVDIRVKNMTKVYRELVEVQEGNSASESINDVLKTVTDQQLMGSRISKSAYHDFGEGIKYLCVMVVLDPNHTDEFFNALMDQSGVAKQISPQDEEVLYHEFKAYKAQQELDRETSGN